ncbi:MAG: trimethylamine methyltransferase family protein [Eubacteriales bacterium]
METKFKVEVLSKEDYVKVHEASLKILDETGCIFHGGQALEIFKKHGAKIDGKKVHFPRKLVEDSLKKCPSRFKLRARNEERSVIVGEGLLIHPPGGEVFITDLDNGRRKGTIKDFANLQKLFQACDDIDIAGYQPISPADIDSRVRGLYCTYESIKNTDKPMLSPMELDNTQQMRESLELMEMSFGKKGFFKENYCTWQAVCPNSPLTYSDYACDGIIEYANWNQPVLVVPAPMSGITAPASMMGTIVLQNAEMLAGLVLAQLVNPGVPVIVSASSTFANLKLATWECSCPETALLVVAITQLNKDFYNLPARVQTGITSSKLVNYQAGYETMQSLLLSALAGAQLTSQSVGSMENLMTVSYEKLLIDTEVVSRVRRILKGIDTSDEALSVGLIQEVGHNAEYLWHDSTIEQCRAGWQPTMADWDSFENWQKAGSEDVLVTANKKIKEILAKAPASIIDEQLDKDLQDYIRTVEKNR